MEEVRPVLDIAVILAAALAGGILARRLGSSVIMGYLIGGIAMVLGVHVKTFSLLLAINMIVALLVVHIRMPYVAAELPLVLLGAVLALYGMGAGEWRLMQKECVCEMKKQ